MRALPLLLALALAACGQAEDEAGAPDEARRLDEAAAKIDINAAVVDNAAEPAQ